MKRILMVLVVAVALAIPNGALAASSCPAYQPTTCGTVGGTTTGTTGATTTTTAATTTPSVGTTTEAAETTTPVTTESSEGTLPFTGLDVALLVIGGGTLLGAGLVVRRLSRRPN
jgi:hypothetical protein